MPVSFFELINNVSVDGWIVVGASLFSLLLAWIIFWQDTKKRSSIFFLALAVMTVVWGASYAFFEGSIGTPLAQMGVTALYASAAAVPVFLFLFLYVFSFEQKKIHPVFIALFFAPYLLITWVLLTSPQVIVTSAPISSNLSHKIIFGELFWVYALYIIAFLIVALIVIVKKYRESAGIFKVAMRELALATAAAYVLAILTSLLSPIFFGGSHDLFWGGHVSVALLMFASAFIITKYNFWNTKVIMTELFISGIVLILIAEIFFASSFADLLLKTAITVLVVVSASFLDGSVKREIESKEKITRLLFDINLISHRLKTLDKKKSDFLSVTSHHLRDPLTVVRGYSSMLLEGSLGELSASAREAVEKIFDSSGRLLAMISDFLNISNIESGNMKYVFRDVDAKKLVLDLAEEMRPTALHQDLIFDVIIDEGIEQGVSFVTVGDEGKLRQVVSNLIDNAIKYTPKGEVSLLLSKSPDKKNILFSVSDTGIGMSEETKEKIFKKFSRAEGVSKVYTEGTGLGLYVAKEVIKKHEGRIWGESKGEGHGSTFYVELDAKVGI
ncbi:MAG: ATP-binding protein [Candidatus Pacebacteria bacterium]|jgi:signal transduction histidine kinase|nr:ATP-binding protein [Candidatus Paceibacterota bacterium]